MTKKEKRLKRRMDRRWWVITDRLKDEMGECADRLEVYFDDDDAKKRIQKEYRERWVELIKQRDLLKNKMETME